MWNTFFKPPFRSLSLAMFCFHFLFFYNQKKKKKEHDFTFWLNIVGKRTKNQDPSIILQVSLSMVLTWLSLWHPSIDQYKSPCRNMIWLLHPLILYRLKVGGTGYKIYFSQVTLLFTPSNRWDTGKHKDLLRNKKGWGIFSKLKPK